MAFLEAIAVPDEQLEGAKGSSNQQKLKDIWWRICSKTGLSKLIAAIAEGVLNFQFDKYDQYGKIIGKSSIRNENAWLPGNFARQAGEIAALRALLEKSLAAQGVAIDPQAIEDAAARGAQKALDNLRIVNVAA